ncbi:pimeloyl-ACP methyl ester carboxylesterase [Pseudorhodoplanes sinuspersici]|nr:pimeloyl-ACP methyl ester carboxylesterase [Pseudorhodoplanes sinuspersici]
MVGDLRVRSYGAGGPLTVVLHGGPAATGNATPIAQELADTFRVLEPFQRGSGGDPLSVSTHIADLHDIIVARAGGERPALVGESWGAMLALAYAAAHPETIGPIALIGCGTFDVVARAKLAATLEARLARGESLYDFAPLETITQSIDDSLDKAAHLQTWEDMIRLQHEGVYPAAFAVITSPVLMLHGSYDPHPGKMIRDSLMPHLSELEYREFDKCGHSPWIERFARDNFFVTLRTWLSKFGQTE